MRAIEELGASHDVKGRLRKAVPWVGMPASLLSIGPGRGTAALLEKVGERAGKHNGSVEERFGVGRYEVFVVDEEVTEWNDITMPAGPALRQMIDDATRDRDLRAPPSNHFEKLGGSLRGWHSIRVSGRWRLVFRWNSANGEAADVYLDDHSCRLEASR